MSVKLIIDSASDISEAEAKSLGVVMMPMAITFGEEEYLDGVNLLPNEFYDKLTTSQELPKTSQITAFRYEEEFKKHVENGDELVVITISSRLSQTYNQAVMASEKFPGKVYVVDSLNACIGERLLGLYALDLIKRGTSAREIKAILDEKKKDVKVLAMIDTLEYLKKGGRISGLVAFAGGLLSLKPMIAVVDGEVKVIGKALGARKGFQMLNRLIEENGGVDEAMPHGVIWSGNDDSNLTMFLSNNDSMGESPKKYILGGTIGTHIGPGAVGVSFFKK